MGFYDEQKITLDEINRILDACFMALEKDRTFDAKGAGSFCKFVKVDGKAYAVLSRRAEKLTLNAIKNIMSIINNREIPVPILGGCIGDSKSGDNRFALVLPEIEGLNLPSYVYPISKNISLIKSAEAIPQEAFNSLATECSFINGKCINIDFHGGNFIFDEQNGKIRMIDLKKRSSYKDEVLIGKFLKLSAYDKLKHLDEESVRKEIGYKEGVDIDYITAKNIIKSYIALSKAGYSESMISQAIKKIYGENVDIDDFDKRC